MQHGNLQVLHKLTVKEYSKDCALRTRTASENSGLQREKTASVERKLKQGTMGT